MKVVDLGKHSNNCLLSSPEQTLADVLQKMRDGEGVPGRAKKVIVICLDDSANGYLYSITRAGISDPHSVALLECAKLAIAKDIT